MKKLPTIVSVLLISPLLINAQAISTDNVVTEEKIRSEVTIGESEDRGISQATDVAAAKAQEMVDRIKTEAAADVPAAPAPSPVEEATPDQGPIAVEVETPEIPVETPAVPEPAPAPPEPAPAPTEPEPAPAPVPDQPEPAPAPAPAEPAPAPENMKPETAPAPAVVDPVPNAPTIPSVPAVSEAKPEMKPETEPAPVPAPTDPTAPVTTTPAPESPTAMKPEDAPAPSTPEPAPATAATQPEPAPAAAEPVEEGRGTRDEAAAAQEQQMEAAAQQARTAVQAEAVQAAQTNDPEKAKDVVARILGVAGVATGVAANVQANRNRQEIRRIEAESIGRTDREREQSVDYLVQRFRGEEVREVPQAYQNRYDQYGRGNNRAAAPPHFRDQRASRRNFDGHRHVRYRSRDEVPAILLASSTLNRVEIGRPTERISQPGFPSAEPIPQAYQAPTAVDLSYKVDAKSEITQDDILFLQGSTAFADDYSNDIVLDLAYAMQDPSLGNMNFVVEGHASAEGSYELNLDLSQRRAERIVREMVRAGVSPQRLIPVGYGESEAYYGADAPENQRRFDRKVVVFRLAQ